MSAYEVWAGWVGRGLCMQLQAALQSDAALTSSTPLQAWEETIIAQVLSPNSAALSPPPPGSVRVSLLTIAQASVQCHWPSA